MAAHQQLFTQLWISGGLIAAATFVHAVFIALGATFFRLAQGEVRGPVRFFRDAGVLVLLALWLMLAHALEMVIWAWAYLRLDLFETIEAALYFAAISYTTLGFGDVLLPVEWGLLAGAIAANGLLLFGLSAAFLVDASLKLRLAGK